MADSADMHGEHAFFGRGILKIRSRQSAVVALLDVSDARPYIKR